MKTYYIADWRRRDNQERTDKLIKGFVALGLVIALACVIGLILTINTAKANFVPNLPLATSIIETNHLPESPNKPYKVITAEISAYTADIAETDDRPLEMANQATVHDGAIACPRNIALGTLVEINGSFYNCEDRMNARYKNNFDIFMWDKQEAIKFGRQVAVVKIY